MGPRHVLCGRRCESVGAAAAAAPEASQQGLHTIMLTGWHLHRSLGPRTAVKRLAKSKPKSNSP